MFPKIKSDIQGLEIEHDNRHRLKRSEFSRESLVYMIEIPEKGIAGFLYTWVSGESKAGVAACLFGPGIGKDPIIEKVDGIDVPFDMDFNNWKVAGLTVQLKEPLKSVYVTYKSDQIDIDYTFEASQPAYAYASHPNGCPQWIADNRFEQQGYTKGKIKLQGKTFDLNNIGQRDHSWGTREWGVNQHWHWLHAQAGEGIGVHFWKLMALGKTHLCGYVYKEGEMAQLANVEIEAKYDKALSIETIHAVATDQLGRVTNITGSSYGSFPLNADPMITLIETPLVLTVDNIEGAGWCETLWPNALLDYMNAKNQD